MIFSHLNYFNVVPVLFLSSLQVMVQSLQLLRRSNKSFMSAMKVFVQEPTMDWLKFAKREAKNNGVAESLNETLFPEKKIQVVKLKLEGGHPIRSTLLEIDHGFNPRDLKLKPKIKEALLGPDESLRRSLWNEEVNDSENDSEVLRPEEVVDILLELATDDALLSCAFVGWKPWV